MKEEIEQILNGDKCWSTDEFSFLRLNLQLAAIELEKYIAQKQIELLKRVDNILHSGLTWNHTFDKIEDLIKEYKQTYNL